MEALSCLQARPNFHEIVSTTNDFHQTLAHLAILYEHPSLLGHLVEWHIDLTICKGPITFPYCYNRNPLY